MSKGRIENLKYSEKFNFFVLKNSLPLNDITQETRLYYCKANTNWQTPPFIAKSKCL